MKKHEKAIQLLVSAFRPPNWDESSKEIYLSVLKNEPEEEVLKRASKAVRNSKFMPSPAELLGNIPSDYEIESILEHADLLYKNPALRQNTDSLTQKTVAVIKKLGGWPAYGRSPDPIMAPPQQVTSFRNQIAKTVTAINIEERKTKKMLETSTHNQIETLNE